MNQTIHTIRTIAIAFGLLAATLLPSSAQTMIRRVVASPIGATQDGSTWAEAMTLSAALTASMTGDQVWIAQGTYLPHATDRDATFSIPAGVLVYGGFAGTEDALADRTGAATILSGDLMNDDLTDRENAGYAATRDDNSNTVVTIGGVGVTLNGLTIQGGEGGTSTDIVGTDRNVGGGLHSAFSTTVAFCTFTNNNAGYLGGGAYFGRRTSRTTVTSCTFTGNTANGIGGGFLAGGGGAAFASTATLTNCIFIDNEVMRGDGGGALFG